MDCWIFHGISPTPILMARMDARATVNVSQSVVVLAEVVVAPYPYLVVEVGVPSAAEAAANHCLLDSYQVVAANPEVAEVEFVPLDLQQELRVVPLELLVVPLDQPSALMVRPYELALPNNGAQRLHLYLVLIQPRCKPKPLSMLLDILKVLEPLFEYYHLV